MRVLIDVVDASRVEAGGASNCPVDFVALVEKEFGEVRSILSGDSEDQRALHRRNNTRPGNEIHESLMSGLLITGCGRSGTAYVAAVFQRLGLRATHEKFFNLTAHQWLPNHMGVESSWLAVPHLHGVPSDVVIAHQVRGPFAVVRSLLGFGFFSNTHSPYRDWLYEHEPDIAEQSNDIDKGLLYWIRWNQRVEKHAVVKHRLEELNADKIQMLAKLAGHPVSLVDVAAVCTAIGTRHNARQRANLSKADVRERPLYEKVKKLAENYGYGHV